MASYTTDSGLLAYAGVLATVLLIGVAGFVAGTLFMFIGIGLLSAIGIDVLERPALEILVSVVTLQGLGFGSVALAYLSTREEGLEFIHATVPGLRDIVWMAGGLVALFGILLGTAVLQTTFGIESAQHSLTQSGLQNPEILLVLMPLSILLVGPGEELLFRGVIQQLLRLRFGIAVGIGTASIIFAFAHVGSLTGEGVAVTLITYIVLSLILGVSYEYSENLVVPAVIHGLFNAIQFGTLYWVATASNAPAVLDVLLVV